MAEYSVDENVRSIILENIVSFGPDGYGPNILCIPKMNNKYVLFDKILNKRVIESEDECLEVNE